MTAITLKNRNGALIIPLSLLGITLLFLCKDLFHAFVMDYNFYLSESLLFGIFWLLFVPFLILSWRLSQKFGKIVNLISPLLVSIFHIAIFSIFVFSLSALFFNHTFSFVRVFSDTLADNGFSCLLIYGLSVFIDPKFQTTVIDKQEDLKKIRVEYKNGVKLLALENILYVRTERPYIALITEERTYLHNSTLKEFIEKMPKGTFIQIHKSTIINTNHICSYKSKKNGDYDAVMLNGDILRVSRNFNDFFKKFSRTNHLA